MGITYTIPRFPLLNQRTEASNANDDCVFTSCAAIVTALTGRAMTGTQIKAMDSDYGPKYTGFASAAKLVDTMDRLGVTLTRRGDSTQSGLVSLVHQFVAAGNPCLVTMPSQWNSATLARGYNPRAYTGPMHVGVACGYGPGMLRVMNPWNGFWQDGSDAYWALRLLTGDVWVATRKPVATAVAAAPAPVAPTPVTTSTVTLNAQELMGAITNITTGLQALENLTKAQS